MIKQESDKSKVTNWVYEDKETIFAVAITDLVKIDKEIEEAIKAQLDGGRNGMSKKTNSKLVKEKEIKLDNKYLGRDMIAELQDGSRIRNLFYIVGNRLYQTVVLGPKDFVESEQANNFFKSFELAK